MTIDQYLLKHNDWKVELAFLRVLLQKTELTESIKWGIPVYTYQAKNIVGLAAFKNYVGLWFYQGALLTDKKGILINAQEGKTQAMRQMRFNSIDEIDSKTISEYLQEAVTNQKLGKEIKPQKKPLVIPPELQEAIEINTVLAEAFEALSLTNKRDFTTYISDAKRKETKQKRLTKITPMINKGIGLNDKYKK